MLINHKYKFIFIHIPKTGGGAVREYEKKYLRSIWRRVSGEIGGPHDPLTPDCCDQFKGYYKFTIVRNPWELVASAYRFQTGGVSVDKYKGLRASEEGIFEWLSKLCSVGGVFPGQAGYYSCDGKVLVDTVIRQDQLLNGMERVLKCVGAPWCEDFWLKPSRHFFGEYDFQGYFKDRRVRDLIERYCADDIKAFGWQAPY